MEQFIVFLHRRDILNIWCGYGIETIPIAAGNGTVISRTNMSFPVLIFFTNITFIYILFNEENSTEIAFVLTCRLCTNNADVLRHDLGPKTRYRKGGTF
jgi:hypothetical protein